MKRFDRFIKQSVALFIYWVNRCEKNDLINNTYLTDSVIDSFFNLTENIVDYNYTTARLKLKQVRRERNSVAQIA